MLSWTSLHKTAVVCRTLQYKGFQKAGAEKLDPIQPLASLVLMTSGNDLDHVFQILKYRKYMEEWKQVS